MSTPRPAMFPRMTIPPNPSFFTARANLQNLNNPLTRGLHGGRRILKINMLAACLVAGMNKSRRSTPFIPK
jgi:hypothetical protein